MFRIRHLAIILALLLFSRSGAEVIGVMDFIPEVFKTKNLSREYALRIDEVLYNSERIGNFLVLTTAATDSLYIGGKLNTKLIPDETLIFDSQNYYTAVNNKSFVSLIPDTRSYLVNSPHGDSAYKSDIFSLENELLKSYIGPDVTVSPDGKYFYTRMGTEKTTVR